MDVSVTFDKQGNNSYFEFLPDELLCLIISNDYNITLPLRVTCKRLKILIDNFIFKSNNIKQITKYKLNYTKNIKKNIRICNIISANCGEEFYLSKVIKLIDVYFKWNAFLINLDHLEMPKSFEYIKLDQYDNTCLLLYSITIIVELLSFGQKQAYHNYLKIIFENITSFRNIIELLAELGLFGYTDLQKESVNHYLPEFSDEHLIKMIKDAWYNEDYQLVNTYLNFERYSKLKINIALDENDNQKLNYESHYVIIKKLIEYNYFTKEEFIYAHFNKLILLIDKDSYNELLKILIDLQIESDIIIHGETLLQYILSKFDIKKVIRFRSGGYGLVDLIFGIIENEHFDPRKLNQLNTLLLFIDNLKTLYNKYVIGKDRIKNIIEKLTYKLNYYTVNYITENGK